MTRTWFAIAKAEFLVLTSGMKGRRAIYLSVITFLGLIWATVVAPMMINGFLIAIFTWEELQVMLMVMFPGLMSTVMMFLFFITLLFPLSYALAEIKIGQWEIFLSNNVRTRDILIGTYVGKAGLYGLVILFLAPILISPFMLAFEVSIIGQVLVYGSLTLMILATIWLSNLLTAVIQARLGDSSRGNDIAKALSMVIAVIVILPMYGLMMFAPMMADLLSLDIFALMPWTWYADFTGWLAINFNGIGLTTPQIEGLGTLMHMDFLTSALIVGGFVLLTIVAGFYSADRIFTIEAGVRTETVTTVGKENIVLRGIRKVSPGPFGTLMVVNMKDFLRKAQNLSKIFYGVVLASVLPFIMSQFGDYYMSIKEILPMIGIMLAIVGVFPFVGQGFLESKDQLWIIQGAPKGASRFIKTRLASAFLIAIPLTVLPVIIIGIMFNATIVEFIFLLGYGYFAVCGAAMIATGITARNPAYEDSKSPAHQANVMAAMLIAQFSMMGILLGGIVLDIGLGIDIFSFIEMLFGPGLVDVGMAIIGVGFMFLIGLGFVFSGIRSLSKPE
ncbi:MAG: hypothetical protein RTU30_00960 [Candidatus Thorarchaeota archaeon]